MCFHIASSQQKTFSVMVMSENVPLDVLVKNIKVALNLLLTCLQKQYGVYLASELDHAN